MPTASFQSRDCSVAATLLMDIADTQKCLKLLMMQFVFSFEGISAVVGRGDYTSCRKIFFNRGFHQEYPFVSHVPYYLFLVHD